MIDERAIIHPTAKLAEGVSIGPWTVIGAEVEIGENTQVGPHVVINGPTKIGKNNKFYQFSSIGEDPQDKKHAETDRTFLEIGDNNIIREYCTLNRGTVQGGGVTKIGSGNLLMAYVHIAHDCIIHNDTVFANNASLAGHVEIHSHAILSGFSGIHQFCVIGEHSFVAKGALVTKDVLPYMMVAGVEKPATFGLNVVGLKRHGFTPETITNLRRAYKTIYRQGLSVADAVSALVEPAKECEQVNFLREALLESKRGIV